MWPIGTLSITLGALLVWPFFLHGAAGTTACYFPDGTIANSDQPCLSNTTYSFCCAFGAICTSSRLCLTGLSNGPAGSRGTCTDQTWNSPECPGFCRQNFQDRGVVVEACSSGKYCCYTNETCCNSSDTFYLEPYSIISTIGVSPSTVSLISSAAITSQTSTTSTPPTPQSPPAPFLNTGEKISIGVGASGLTLISILGFIIIRSRRRLRDLETQVRTLSRESRSGHPVPVGVSEEALELPQSIDKSYELPQSNGVAYEMPPCQEGVNTANDIS